MWGGIGGGSKEFFGYFLDEELNFLLFIEFCDKVFGFDFFNVVYVNKVRVLIVVFGWMSVVLNINLFICILLYV